MAGVVGPEVVGSLSFAASYVGVFAFILGVFGPSNIKLISENIDIPNRLATFTRLQLISIFLFL